MIPKKIITDYLKDIPGELHQSEWVNFEYNRNEALQFAKDKGDYLLFIDADEQLQFSEGSKWQGNCKKIFE
jgi:glycosyltransferase involved in cell wall biosynthesis